MKRIINCGIDIGTHAVRVVVVETGKGDDIPFIVGHGYAESNGIRMGYITNIEAVVTSIKSAMAQAENSAGLKIKRAYVSIGGIGISSETSSGSAIITRADKEVTVLDINKALSECEENLNTQNKKIIHVIPLQYKLDGKEIHGRPEGMKGAKLEAKTLFVTAIKQHVEDLATAVTLAGIEVLDIVSGILAESYILLSEKQKAAGCALIDIGAQTVSLAVFENSTLISLQVFSIGGMDITKDIALGFKIALEDAESVKIGAMIGDFPKKRLDEIVDARLGDIFELVENHLRKIKRNGLLPAGVIITGGGSNIHTIEMVAKQYLKLPAHLGAQSDQLVSKFKVRDDSWYAALALALSPNLKNSSSVDLSSSVNDSVKNLKGVFKSFLSQLLP